MLKALERRRGCEIEWKRMIVVCLCLTLVGERTGLFGCDCGLLASDAGHFLWNWRCLEWWFWMFAAW